LKLIIVHYHLRPGGIRRIIELGTPPVVREFGGAIARVVLAAGEAPPAAWESAFRQQVAVPAELFIAPEFHYLSEQPASPREIALGIRANCRELLKNSSAGNTLVWAHNLGIGRNLLLARELVRACASHGVPLISHHHDWWFDNRWLRWAEMRRFGFTSLKAAAKAIFPPLDRVQHVGINSTDARLLESAFPNHSAWVPNLTERGPSPDRARLSESGAWLRARLRQSDAPIWILPCRLLRRKNVCETLLLTRWLRPEAWLVTTGGASSADEQPYVNKLQEAARAHHWRLRLGVLEGKEANAPSVAELLAVSEAVLLTSIQEGFGLPYLEAAAAGRPLIARRLPNVAPDLDAFGFEFPQSYDDILIDPSLFGWEAESQRQQKLFAEWRNQLPRLCRSWIALPALLETENSPQPVPFSRLTLTGQLEVLAAPADLSWSRCAPLNPFLSIWKKRAAHERLQITPWPEQAAEWLSGPAYGRKLHEIASRQPAPAPDPKTGIAAQETFIREKLGGNHLFPLLWSRET
jgi:glycosyltransferase involved in cell wall biosynthesis